MDVIKDFRYSHSDGLTFAGYDLAGKYILTSGSDGDVRVYKNLDDDDYSFRVGARVTAFAVQEKEIAVATETNDVKTFLIPEGTQQDILLRFTAQINSICFGKAKKVIAAGASDFIIKVVNREDDSQKVMNGHEAPVLCVCFGPKDNMLASSSCDGTLKIWNIDSQECLHTLNIFPKCNDTSSAKILCKIAWCSGKTEAIAVPNEKGIKLISTDNWTELCQLNGSHTDLVSVVACSPCSNFLASSSINGELAVWDISQRKELKIMKHENSHKITSINWNPIGAKSILVADDQGMFGVCDGLVPVKAHQDEQQSVADIFDDSDNEGTKKEKRRKRALESDDDVDDDDEPVGSSRKKNRIQNMENFLDDEAEDDDDDDPETSINLIKSGLLPEKPLFTEDDAADDKMTDFIVDDKPKKPSMPNVSLQKAFQPGSTPDHLMHRFMAWNSVGIIRAHSEDEISTIDIEFHDASLHHPLHFTNVMDHTMAALSSTAVVLACESQLDGPSKFVCLHFGTWDSTKEWTVAMPKGEEIQSIAVNRKFIAIATNSRLVRIFTVGGLQYHMFSIAGPVVAMAMTETQLMIVYHQGLGVPSCQCLGMQLLEIGKSKWRLSVEQQLPISRKSTLVWIGFTYEETPLTVDSRGIVRMFQRGFGCTWIPVLNLKNQTKNSSDNYWIIGVTENPPEARAVFCKGANFPATLPRPLPTSLPLQIPLCDKDTEKTKLEQNLLRGRVVNQYHAYHKKKGLEEDESAAAEAKTTEIQLLMKLFALSCKSDRIFRAVEICELMPNAETVSLAIQYATKMRKMNLAQRLGELARRKAEEEFDSDNEDQSDEEDLADEGGFSRLTQKGYGSSQMAKSSLTSRHPKALMYNGKRSIGRPQMKQRERKDSSEDSLDGFDPGNGDAAADDIKDDHDDDIELEEMDIAEEMEHQEDMEATEEAPSKSTNGTNGRMFGQGRSNPFKLTPKTKAKSNSATKGTTYFETLKSTLPPKNKLAFEKEQASGSSNKDKKKDGPKQATLFQSKSPGNAGKSEKVEKKESTGKNKKVTGFMLFREHLSTQLEDMDKDDFVSKSLGQWKSLSNEEKKTWNMKAKGTGNLEENKKVNKDLNENDEKGIKTVNQVKEKTNASTQNTKSKLAAFAFHKA